jgi:hypothetical protein
MKVTRDSIVSKCDRPVSIIFIHVLSVDFIIFYLPLHSVMVHGAPLEEAFGNDALSI